MRSGDSIAHVATAQITQRMISGVARCMVEKKRAPASAEFALLGEDRYHDQGLWGAGRPGTQGVREDEQHVHNAPGSGQRIRLRGGNGLQRAWAAYRYRSRASAWRDTSASLSSNERGLRRHELPIPPLPMRAPRLLRLDMLQIMLTWARTCIIGLESNAAAGMLQRCAVYRRGVANQVLQRSRIFTLEGALPSRTHINYRPVLAQCRARNRHQWWPSFASPQGVSNESIVKHRHLRSAECVPILG